MKGQRKRKQKFAPPFSLSPVVGEEITKEYWLGPQSRGTQSSALFLCVNKGACGILSFLFVWLKSSFQSIRFPSLFEVSVSRCPRLPCAKMFIYITRTGERFFVVDFFFFFEENQIVKAFSFKGVTGLVSLLIWLAIETKSNHFSVKNCRLTPHCPPEIYTIKTSKNGQPPEYNTEKHPES